LELIMGRSYLHKSVGCCDNSCGAGLCSSGVGGSSRNSGWSTA